eukprot:NODE_9107_length_619_cov_50.457661_g8479_i0.p1 GENE.NODE_9107_length_619_cov_50.457661_g8479_i0~~NODE_9107_length_619_cov_50.457661_g8479_i0.p1  ORF type:complete len:176 (+),score=31.78 NODE_9107_length_619_cov_50.457661_g8479_i0:55-528(+)
MALVPLGTAIDDTGYGYGNTASPYLFNSFQPSSTYVSPALFSPSALQPTYGSPYGPSYVAPSYVSPTSYSRIPTNPHVSLPGYASGYASKYSYPANYDSRIVSLPTDGVLTPNMLVLPMYPSTPYPTGYPYAPVGVGYPGWQAARRKGNWFRTRGAF